jgi:hypothetical protein
MYVDVVSIDHGPGGSTVYSDATSSRLRELISVDGTGSIDDGVDDGISSLIRLVFTSVILEQN